MTSSYGSWGRIGQEPDMNRMDVPNPLWGIILLVVILAWLTLSMWLQATNFDSTEGKAITMIAAPLLAGWSYWFYRFYRKDK